MFSSKFSVLSKFFKYSNFKQNALRRMLRCERRSIMTRQKCFTKNTTNTLEPQGTSNLKSLNFNKNPQFNISRNMGSSSNEGDENAAKLKKLIEKRKKKLLRRRSKVKILKTSQIKCKRCKTKKLLEDQKSENVKNEIAQHTRDLSNKKGSIKMEIPELINNDQGISQSHTPPKRVHVEFMESQNLKDFNLNKSPSLELNRNNAKENIIDIKIKPINSVNDQRPSNAIAIENNIKNTIHNLETQHLTKSNFDFRNKKLLKSGEKKAVQEKEDPVITNTNSKGISLQEIISNNNISRQNNSTIAKKNENIRILYQAHPKRKTKVKIPKLMKSEKTTRVKFSEQDETQKAELPKQSIVPVERKGILFPTEPGEFLNFKIQSKNLTTDIKSFLTSDKGILYPTENIEQKKDSISSKKIKPLPNIDTDLLKISTTKQDLYSAKTEIKEISTPKLAENNQTLNNSKSTTISTISSSKGISERASSNNFLKAPTNSKTVQKPANDQYANMTGSNIKVILAFQASEKSTNSLKRDGSPINSLAEYNISPDKLKNEDTKLKTANTVSKMARSSPNLGSATIKTNKLTKSKRSSRGGNHDGNQSGGGGRKTTINEEVTTTIKDRPSRFWRTLSFTILPLIFGLTVYTMSNRGAAEVFKRLRNARSSEDPLSWKLLPTFYGKKSNDDGKKLNDIETEENEDEEPLNESEQLETFLKDPRLNEA